MDDTNIPAGMRNREDPGDLAYDVYFIVETLIRCAMETLCAMKATIPFIN